MNCSVQFLVRMSIKYQVQVLQVLLLFAIHKIQNNIVDRMPMAFAMPNKTLEFCTAQRPMAMAAEIPLTIDQHYFMRWYQLVDGTVSTGQYLVAWVQQLRCLREDGAAAGSGGAAAGHQQHGVPGVLRQHAELQLSPARCRHHKSHPADIYPMSQGDWSELQ